MSGRKYRQTFEKGIQWLDSATSKNIGQFLFEHTPDDPGKMLKTQSLAASAVIQGPKEYQAHTFYLTLATLYGCEAAQKQADILRDTSIAVNGLGREQGTRILEGGRLPKEIEIDSGEV